MIVGIPVPLVCGHLPAGLDLWPYAPCARQETKHRAQETSCLGHIAEDWRAKPEVARFDAINWLSSSVSARTTCPERWRLIGCDSGSVKRRKQMRFQGLARHLGRAASPDGPPLTPSPVPRARAIGTNPLLSTVPGAFSQKQEYCGLTRGYRRTPRPELPQERADERVFQQIRRSSNDDHTVDRLAGILTLAGEVSHALRDRKRGNPR